MSTARDFAQQVYAKLAGILDDMTTLTVVTHTVAPDGTPTERARTEIAIDGDTDHRLPLDAKGGIDDALLKQHQAAVTQARAERQAIWDTVMKVVTGAIEVEKSEAER